MRQRVGEAVWVALRKADAKNLDKIVDSDGLVWWRNKFGWASTPFVMPGEKHERSLFVALEDLTAA